MKSLIKLGAIVAALTFGAGATAANEISSAGGAGWKNDTVITGNGFGFTEWNLWVDARVANLAFTKVVGMVWTDDNWASQHTTYLTYEQTYPDGFEQWGADIQPVGQYNYTRFGNPTWTNAFSGNSQSTTTVTVEYALFYEVNGQIFWDNNGSNNFTIDLF